jgi:hypothetical protein
MRTKIYTTVRSLLKFLVSLVLTVVAGQAATGLNSGFESPDIADGTVAIGSAANGEWLFATNDFGGSSGITDPPNTLSSLAAAEGNQYAFIRVLNQVTAAQFVYSSGFVGGGTFSLSFLVAGGDFIANGDDGVLNYSVVLDPNFGSQVLFSDTTASGQPFTIRQTTFTLGAGPHTIEFIGSNTGTSGTHTAFFDRVIVVPEPGVVTLAVAGCLAITGFSVWRRKNECDVARRSTKHT